MSDLPNNIDIPYEVQQKAEHRGRAGLDWLNALPVLTSELSKEWNLSIGEALTGGTEGFVVRAITATGQDVVIKLEIPSDDFSRGVRLLESANGRGYVKLLNYDENRYAVMLEALGPALTESGLASIDQIEVLCKTLQNAWTVSLDRAPTLVEAKGKAQDLREMIVQLDKKLDHGCSRNVITMALDLSTHRITDASPDNCVIVHGDPHPANSLQVREERPGSESGYVFIDPDGFLCERAYDLGVVLRDWSSEVLSVGGIDKLRDYCHKMSFLTGVSEKAVWEWGYVERVSTGLYALDHGLYEMAKPFLDSAEKIATS